MKSYDLVLPIYWTKTYKTKKDKTVLVGMNFYRNAHYFDQNALKQEIGDFVKEQVEGLNIYGPYTLHLYLYYKNSNCDGANICSLIEKIVLDALQTFKVVEQDNVKFHKGTTWEIVKQDKENPRCEIKIKRINYDKSD